MPSYNVHEAKSNLSRLLKQTAEGERVIIMRDGNPVAELVPYRQPGRKIRLGFAAGQVRESEGWDKPMTDQEVAAFLDDKASDIYWIRIPFGGLLLRHGNSRVRRVGFVAPIRKV